MRVGQRQKDFLEYLRKHGVWNPGCGWTMGSQSEDARLAESLVRRGVAWVRPYTSGDGVVRLAYRPMPGPLAPEWVR